MAALRTRFPRDTLFLSALVIILSGYWLGFHWSSLALNYWNWDDFHIVRRFTSAELTHAFSATWDPDGIEYPGFRPFTVLFNHIRFVVIGEAPACQRLFVLAMMTGLLWLIGWLSLQAGLRRIPVALGLLILVSTKAFSGQILWITDGIFVFQTPYSRSP